MKRKKAALYDPFLDTLGGGERYVLSIMKELEAAGYSADIFWKNDLSKEIFSRLKIKFDSDNFRTEPFFSTNRLVKIWGLKEYDIFLYITDGSYIFSGAKKNFVYCMVPQKNLYNMNLINRLKTSNTGFITHSEFTKKSLMSWGVEAQLLYPYVDEAFLVDAGAVQDKEDVILSVGRFFPQLHSKRHDVVIDLFKRLRRDSKAFGNYRLVLAGGMKKEDEGYYHKIQKLAEGDKSIVFCPNLSFEELVRLYKKSRFYWHCAGWGIDDDKNPEMVEHLGIAPLEAMASGCIPFVYKSGGVKELVQDGVTGYAFENPAELIKKIEILGSDKILEEQIRAAGKRYIEEKFSREVYRKNIRSLFIQI